MGLGVVVDVAGGALGWWRFRSRRRGCYGGVGFGGALILVGCVVWVGGALGGAGDGLLADLRYRLWRVFEL